MFDEIYNNTLLVRTEHPIKGIFAIPSSNAFSVLRRLWQMVSWLHDDFILDCNASAGVGFPQDEDFRLRSTSRTLSYVVQVSTLEKIIERVYRDIFVSIRIYTGQNLIPNDNEISLRYQEFASIKAFRDMVAGHTVYGSPRNNDNLSLELTSLFVLLSSSTNPQGDLTSFTLGSGSVVAGSQTPSRTIPSIGIRNTHQIMTSHYQSWTNMISQTLTQSHSILPIKNADFIIDLLHNNI